MEKRRFRVIKYVIRDALESRSERSMHLTEQLIRGIFNWLSVTISFLLKKKKILFFFS